MYKSLVHIYSHGHMNKYKYGFSCTPENCRYINEKNSGAEPLGRMNEGNVIFSENAITRSTSNACLVK